MPHPIPEHMRPVVDRGLMAAFGTAELDSVAVLSGGLSGAAVYRIRVGGIAYALRLTLSQDPLRDPVRGFACMGTAAQAFLAPTVRYASPGDGVTIMDLLEARPLFDYPGDGGPLIVELAQTARLLHQTPTFPALVDYMTGMGELIGQLRASGALDPATSAELFDRYAGLAAAYRTAPGDVVSSHNDINPGNVIYDGRRLWLIDWEAAFAADRYVDLATIANWFVRSPDHEALLLATYFGGPLNPEQRARFAVMRVVNHVFAGVIFLNSALAERPCAQAGRPDAGGAGPGADAPGPWLGRGELRALGRPRRLRQGAAGPCARLLADGRNRASFADRGRRLTSPD